MNPRLPIVLILACLIFSAGYAKDPAPDFRQIYHIIALERQPLLHDLCSVFIAMDFAATAESTGAHAVWFGSRGNGGLLLEFDKGLIRGVDMKYSWGQASTSHPAPQAHGTMDAMEEPGSQESSGSIYIIQPRPAVP